MTNDITKMLDVIMNMNLNQCSATTYDLNLQECVRTEIVKQLANHYNIEYKIKPKENKIFPVQGVYRA